MAGATNLGRFLAQFGPSGSCVRVAGLCDVAEVGFFSRTLARHGMIERADRAWMAAAGFFVCIRDLEDELIRALRPHGVEAIIGQEGELASLRRLQQMPFHRGKAVDEQLHRFLGAVLILPAIVALVASNFARDQRPRAYGLVASAGAIAVAAGPLIGGLFTTYASWRWVFAGEVLIVVVILFLARKIADTPPQRGVKLDLVGTALSAAGLGLIVYGVLRAGSWGFVKPKPNAPEWLGVSPVIWLITGGAVVLLLFLSWEDRLIAQGKEPLINLPRLRNRVLRGGLIAFMFQYLLQAGLFFVIPLFLSVALGLSAIATGVRILPLSVTLLLAAVGVPRLFPRASPRLVVRVGFLALFAGIAVMVALLDISAGPEIVTWPMLLAGLGIGALASQLGAVTVSSVPDERSGEVGGLQNTVTNLGASIGTALAGAVLIAALTSSFYANLAANPDVPERVVSQAQVELTSGVPFISDKDLQTALDEANVRPAVADAIVNENADARIDGLRAALAVLGLLALLAFISARRLPTVQPDDPRFAEALVAPD